MADDTVVNGVAVDLDDQMTEEVNWNQYQDLRIGRESEISELNCKIEALEVDKYELSRGNKEYNAKIKTFTDKRRDFEIDNIAIKDEIDKLQSEMDQLEEDKKAFEAIRPRTAELETEVARLQQDFICSMSESKNAITELRQLKEAFEKLKESDHEKDLKVEDLEKERVSLLERIRRAVEETKKSNAKYEIRIHQLEKKISILEAKKVNNSMPEGDVKAKLLEKENKILQLQNDVVELQSEVVRNLSELQKSQQEMKETVTLKSSLEGTVKKFEGKFKEMEMKAGQLQIELKESKALIRELEETYRNMTDYATKGKESSEEEKGNFLKGSKLKWPIVVASSGTVVAVATLFYLSFSRRRYKD